MVIILLLILPQHCRFRGPGGARLLQRRGGLVVRKLAARLGGRAVLSMLSSILEDEQDLPFAAALVQALNLILLTAPEVGPNTPLCSPFNSHQGVAMLAGRPCVSLSEQGQSSLAASQLSLNASC